MSTLKRTSVAFILAFSFLLLAFPAFVDAQPSRITHTIVKKNRDAGVSMGRDLWFTMAQNYEGQSGKYYELYVTSPNNTSVRIQVTGGSAKVLPLTAYGVVSYRIPLGWEVTTSGIVEDKGIRVWSKDAELTAYLLSRNPYTSDGMYIIPTIGWGPDYVVAAYHSLYEGFGNFVFDYPSEFSIVANQDNTNLRITPHCDIRFNQDKNKVLHKKGVIFTETLNRGQCIQYQAIEATNGDDFDMTGSVVRSSDNSIGVVGASQCPNIPVDYTYCDHICDMIPPLRTWANTYFTVPFVSRVGGDTYCVIASKVGQTIYRNGNVYCNLNQYESYFRADISDASVWTSDAPFLLAQYINSTTWTDPVTGKDNDGIGDPAMVVVNAVEQFTPRVIFQTPTITTGTGFTNYCNIIINAAAVKSTTLDGIAIGSAPGVTQIVLPTAPTGAYQGVQFKGYRVSKIKPGTHRIVSDSGVGVYIYGYGSYDSYAWSGSLGIRTYNDPDTIAPVARTSGTCYDALVTVADNHLDPPASKLSDINIDSNYQDNFLFTLDPNFISGSNKIDTSYYTIHVVDPTKEAYIKVSAYDRSGNHTTITSVYKPMTATITPPIQNFGTGSAGTKTYLDYTITNTGKIPYTISNLFLYFGTKGFSVESPDMSDIPVGGTRIITLSFDPRTIKTVTDTIIIDDGCTKIQALMVGNGGAADFVVAGYDFGCHSVGDQVKQTELTIVNTSSTQPITITDIFVDDPVHFSYDKTAPAANVLPFTIAPKAGSFNGTKKVEIGYVSNTVGNFSTIIHIVSQEAGEKTTVLKGCTIAPGAKVEHDSVVSVECATNVPFVFTVRDTGTERMTISKIVIVGNPNFPQPTAITNPAGQLITLPANLNPGEEFFVFVTFNAPPKASGTYSATLFAISDKGDTSTRATATVNAVYRDFTVTKGLSIFAPVPFGSAKMTDVFTVCNPLADSVEIRKIKPSPGKYTAAYNITGYSVGGSGVTLPHTLAKDECMDITVEFDPSKIATDSLMIQNFTIETNSCLQPLRGAQAQASVTFGPPTILGDDAPLTFSCNSRTLKVKLTNANPPSSNVIVTIKTITPTGTDAANFVPGTPASMTVNSGSSLDIPVTFIPTASATPLAYNAFIDVLVSRTGGPDTLLKAKVTGTSDGINTKISSIFAIADQNVVANPNKTISLPIAVEITKDPALGNSDQAGIQKVQLVYTYNTDILHIDPNAIASAVNPIPGWSVDAASNIVEGTTGTLTLILKGQTPIDDNTKSLGTITFAPMLAIQQSTDVTLTSVTLFHFDNSPVTGCVAVEQVGTKTALVYECGDKSLIDHLNGKAPSYIAPAMPNPVSTTSGDIVKFQYATRHEGKVTLTLVDELGRESARILDHMYHPAGGYQVLFNTSALPSGSYTYRLQLDNYISSGRLIVNH